MLSINRNYFIIHAQLGSLWHIYIPTNRKMDQQSLDSLIGETLRHLTFSSAQVISGSCTPASFLSSEDGNYGTNTHSSSAHLQTHESLAPIIMDFVDEMASSESTLIPRNDKLAGMSCTFPVNDSLTHAVDTNEGSDYYVKSHKFSTVNDIGNKKNGPFDCCENKKNCGNNSVNYKDRTTAVHKKKKDINEDKCGLLQLILRMLNSEVIAEPIEIVRNALNAWVDQQKSEECETSSDEGYWAYERQANILNEIIAICKSDTGKKFDPQCSGKSNQINKDELNRLDNLIHELISLSELPDDLMQTIISNLFNDETQASIITKNNSKGLNLAEKLLLGQDRGKKSLLGTTNNAQMNSDKRVSVQSNELSQMDNRTDLKIDNSEDPELSSIQYLLDSILESDWLNKISGEHVDELFNSTRTKIC